MNKTFIIIQREFMNRASKKSFILLTILMPFIFAATVLLPGHAGHGEKRRSQGSGSR